MNEFQAHILIMTALAIINIIVCQLLINQLKKEFPAEYTKAGGFHIIFNNTPRSTLMLWSWLLGRSAQELGKSIIFKTYTVRLITGIILVWFFTFLPIIFG
ncbi:hypothetical protein [Paracidovorax oryzae]|uniref:hypothetical protein n=1 Tax=Paracidovorax oryzae TaxID=862720 RepID=UPI0012FF4EA5|nr:hypothetical protein [Paracidovorax oryzae]